MYVYVDIIRWQKESKWQAISEDKLNLLCDRNTPTAVAIQFRWHFGNLYFSMRTCQKQLKQNKENSKNKLEKKKTETRATHNEKKTKSKANGVTVCT